MADDTETHSGSDQHDYHAYQPHDEHDEHEHHGHDSAGEEKLTECPSCGEPIQGADDIVRGDPVPEIRSIRKRSVMVGRQPNDLWMCKGCGATLGVRLRD
ncbi:hypothetical protein ACH9L7_04385 [Haloferax sp. S1W]|uniref:hypothetical protein n=1 Tax=Haloferax sp. S1W TaxID=3377110 RepID=UPI0037C7D33E